jgi:hypothetical protein
LGFWIYFVFSRSGLFYDESTMKTVNYSLLLAFSLAGCAKINDAGMQLLSSSSPAVAVVNDTVLTGKAVLFTDRTGTLDLDSGTQLPLKCMGNLRFTATRSGVVSLACNDGTTALMTFTTIHETSGYGTGKTDRGVASFTFGLDREQASAYLKLPGSKTPDVAPVTATKPQ